MDNEQRDDATPAGRWHAIIIGMLAALGMAGLLSGQFIITMTATAMALVYVLAFGPQWMVWLRNRLGARRFGAAALITVAVLGAAAAAVTSLFPIRSQQTRPARVLSGSMAEHYWGEHWKVTCGGCGSTFRCGVEHPPDEMLARCPNCGHAENRIDASQRHPGMAVGVVPRNFADEPPRRWEVVAFGEPGTDHVAVKRIVGLPGERIAIRGGEVFADGRIIRKSLSDLRRIAQLVHDDRFRPRHSEASSRWQPAEANSGWQETGGAFRHRSEAFANSEADRPRFAPHFDWLRYRHRRGEAASSLSGSMSPVLDDYAYNQGLSRGLNAVTDLLLSCRAGLGDGGAVAVQMHDGRELWQVRLDPRENLVAVFQDGQQLAVAPTSAPLVGDWIELEVAVCDGRILCAINGQQQLQFDIAQPDAPCEPTAFPIDIGTDVGRLEMADLQVLRDVYYLNPHGRAGDWEVDEPLGEDEYFLLGDNPPNSRDSRHYGPVKRAALVGTVRRRVSREDEAPAEPR